MKGKFSITDPDEIKFTMTVTMTLGEWKRLKTQLSNSPPSTALYFAVVQMINKVENEYTSDDMEVKP